MAGEIKRTQPKARAAKSQIAASARGSQNGKDVSRPGSEPPSAARTESKGLFGRRKTEPAGKDDGQASGSEAQENGKQSRGQITKKLSKADLEKVSNEQLLGTAPEALFGHIMKKRGKQKLLLKEFQQRLVRIDNAKVYWWPPSDRVLAEQEGPKATEGFKGCVDLQANQCEVVAEGVSRFELRPLSGHWQSGEFDGYDSGRAFVFDVTDSEHDREKWIEVIKEHIAYVAAEWDELGKKANHRHAPRNPKEAAVAEKVQTRSGGVLKAPKNWEFLETMMPTNRTDDESAVRSQLFERMDVNGTGKLGVIEVRTVVANIVRIPGIKDYTPAVQLAMKSTRETTRMIGDYGREWLNLKCFRIFLFFLKHYIQLWVCFLAMNENGDNRLDVNEFVAGGAHLVRIGVKKPTKAMFKDIEKGNPDYLRFDEFAEFATQSGAHKDLACHPDEVAEEGIFEKGAQKAARNPTMSQAILDFKTINQKLPLLRDKESVELRLAFWHILEKNKSGILSPHDLTHKLLAMFPIPGIGNYNQPVRMAFAATLEGMELEGGASCDGIGWDAFYALVYYLGLYVELWVRFCIADSSGDLRLDSEEFTSVASLLKNWGLTKEVLGRLETESDAVFLEVDHDGSGYIRFLEFVDWCMQHMAYEVPSLAADPKPDDATSSDSSVQVGVSKLMTQPPLVDWDAISKHFPSDFGGRSVATRRELFDMIDGNGNGKLVLFEVNEAVKRVLHLRVRDYTPALRLAFADTIAALPTDASEAVHDYCEEIGWRQFRVFNLFLVRYMQLWVNFLGAGGGTSDRRIHSEDFLALLPQLTHLGVQVGAEKLSNPAFAAATYRKLVGNSDEGVPFPTFARWCMENCARPNLNLSFEEENPGMEAPLRSQVMGYTGMSAVLLENGLGIDANGLQAKLRTSIGKASGRLRPLEIHTTLPKLLVIPGLLSYEPPVRLAFEAVSPRDADGSLDVKQLAELTQHLHIYLELWVIFSAADSLQKRSISRDQLASVLPHLQEWGLEEWDAEVAFQQMDVQGTGAVVFEDLADYCIKNHVGKFGES